MKTRLALVCVIAAALLGAIAAYTVLPVAERAMTNNDGVAALTPAIADEPVPPADLENQVQAGKPIVSVGSGLRAGVALVTGPSSQVEKVKVVAQIEGDFHGAARIRAFVPVDTESLTELHRVPRTSVAGLADIKL
jgi:hypothetical protein